MSAVRPFVQLVIAAGGALLLAGCLIEEELAKTDRKSPTTNSTSQHESHPTDPTGYAPPPTDTIDTPREAHAQSDPQRTYAPADDPATPSTSSQPTNKVTLSTGVALEQTLPTGTAIGFSVTYEFFGNRNRSAQYFWVIESSRDGAVGFPVPLRERGELNQFVPKWRKSHGPFHCHIAEATSKDSPPRKISNSIELRHL